MITLPSAAKIIENYALIIHDDFEVAPLRICHNQQNTTEGTTELNLE
jgi:hypothetical protein